MEISKKILGIITGNETIENKKEKVWDIVDEVTIIIQLFMFLENIIFQFYWG